MAGIPDAGVGPQFVASVPPSEPDCETVLQEGARDRRDADSGRDDTRSGSYHSRSQAKEFESCLGTHERSRADALDRQDKTVLVKSKR